MQRAVVSILVVVSLLLGGVLGSAVGNPLASAQDDDELIERIEELEEDIDEFDERIDDLEEKVDALDEGSGDNNGPVGDIDPRLLITTWEVDSASAWAECDDPNGLCAYRYQADWTTPLVIDEDGSFTWEGPFEEGVYETQPRGESIYLELILTNDDGERCLGTYDSIVDEITIEMADCRGFMWENQYEKGKIQELTQGSVIFVPER